MWHPQNFGIFDALLPFVIWYSFAAIQYEIHVTFLTSSFFFENPLTGLMSKMSSGKWRETKRQSRKLRSDHWVIPWDRCRWMLSVTIWTIIFCQEISHNSTECPPCRTCACSCPRRTRRATSSSRWTRTPRYRRTRTSGSGRGTATRGSGGTSAGKSQSHATSAKYYLYFLTNNYLLPPLSPFGPRCEPKSIVKESHFKFLINWNLNWSQYIHDGMRVVIILESQSVHNSFHMQGGNKMWTDFDC